MQPRESAFGKIEALAKGGQVTPQRATRFAVPASQSGIERTGRGVPSSDRPRNLPNTFLRGNYLFQRLPDVSAPPGRMKITQRYAGGQKRTATYGYKRQNKRRLMYVLPRAVMIRAQVPLYQDFEEIVLDLLAASLPDAVTKAMETAYTRRS
jgi:hypothetical protein